MISVSFLEKGKWMFDSQCGVLVIETKIIIGKQKRGRIGHVVKMLILRWFIGTKNTQPQRSTLVQLDMAFCFAWSRVMEMFTYGNVHREGKVAHLASWGIRVSPRSQRRICQLSPNRPQLSPNLDKQFSPETAQGFVKEIQNCIFRVADPMLFVWVSPWRKKSPKKTHETNLKKNSFQGNSKVKRKDWRPFF